MKLFSDLVGNTRVRILAVQANSFSETVQIRRTVWTIVEMFAELPVLGFTQPIIEMLLDILCYFTTLHAFPVFHTFGKMPFRLFS